jgi:hypothetical protein
MKKTQLYALLDAEIKWCLDDKNRTMPEDWHKGFIEGLKQAKRLIKSSPNLTVPKE